MIGFKKRFDRVGHVWRQRPKQRLRLKWLLLLLAAAGFAYWFFSGSNGKEHKKADIPVLVAPSATKDVPVYLNGLGTVQAYNTVTVHTQVDGKLMEVLFKEGQDVHAGDVLVKIDPRTFQAQYDQAVANKAKDMALLENANRDLSRYIKLGKAVSDQVRDTQRSTVHQLEATVAADQAAIDNAKTQLSYTIIQSPINGRTGIRQVDAGNIVHASDATGLVVITQLEPVSVIFSLPQQNLTAITEQMNAGNKLSVMAMDANNQTVVDTGVLELVDNQIDQNTGTIRLKATFPNSKKSLWPGGFTNVRLLVTIRHNAVVVPVASIQRGPQNSYVFIYKPDDNGSSGTVAMRTVKVAMTEGQDAVIEDGISEGDRVVTDGMGKLQDGSHVTIASPDKEGDKAGAKNPDGSDKKDDGGEKKDGKDKKHHGHKQE